MLRYESYGFYSASLFDRIRSLSSEGYRSDRDKERIEEFQFSSAYPSSFNLYKILPHFSFPEFEGISESLRLVELKALEKEICIGCKMLTGMM